MGIIIGGVGGPLAFSSASGGRVFGYNNINETTATVVAQINPGRQRIRFHNPGPNDIFVAPVFVQNILGIAPTQPSNVALNLPACSGSLLGLRAIVTDASSPTFNVAVTGGSSTRTAVMCNGTTWIAN